MPKPVIEFFEPQRLGPKDWGSEILVAHTIAYTLKVLRMNAGKAGPLQYHRYKDESFHLIVGEAIVRYDDGGPVLAVHRMQIGESIHVPPGATHQVEAVTDCLFVEASTPHFDDRVGVVVPA